MDLLPVYPAAGVERDRWIAERRGERNRVDPNVPYAFLVEDECARTGEVVTVATVFLTNRECPWRCAMCDLWKNTLRGPVPLGAIPRQIEYALERLPRAREIKLYNSGSFFDCGAIPPGDDAAIAGLVGGFERVIVESHPMLIGERCFRFRDLLGDGRLEVAIGLETADPEALERLNKGITLEDFAGAAERLRVEGIGLRVFVLVQPPFVAASEALLWAERSIDFAFGCGATAVSLIATRGGNGAMEELARMGEFEAPELGTVEAAFRYGLGLGRGRVFADLWEIERVRGCAGCQGQRVERLRRMNLSQKLMPVLACAVCGRAA